MSKQRHIRELALQALYQLDARGRDDFDQIEQSIKDAPHADDTKEKAIELAHSAWLVKDGADQLSNKFSNDWPVNRQPIVDRSIIRLACYEISSGLTPAPVMINEAVELGKSFGSEKSSAFINGLLDRIAKQIDAEGDIVQQLTDMTTRLPDQPLHSDLAIPVTQSESPADPPTPETATASTPPDIPTVTDPTSKPTPPSNQNTTP